MIDFAPVATTADLEKSALRGRPSLVWRAGQQRRLRMILEAAEGRERGWILDNGCGIGLYLEHLTPLAERALGLERDLEHAGDARDVCSEVISARSERLPFPDGIFDLIVSHEVLEHVGDDRFALREMVRTLRAPAGGKLGGRLVLFVPNRGYPFETHGVYWRGRYRFGNIPLVNYLPTPLRNRLAPHVRAYTARQLRRLADDLPVRIVRRTVIYGGYDNLVARWPRFGPKLRAVLQWLERTPLRGLGLSHFWVLERLPDAGQADRAGSGRRRGRVIRPPPREDRSPIDASVRQLGEPHRRRATELGGSGWPTVRWAAASAPQPFGHGPE